MRIAAGQEVVVTRGELMLVEPVRWLGETGWPAMRRLRGGDSQRIDSAGWFTLTAVRDCELTWVAHSRVAALASASFASAGRAAAGLATPVNSWAQTLVNVGRGLARHARRVRHALHGA